MKFKKVHIVDDDDRLLYTQLWDDGESPILHFDPLPNGKQCGFVDRVTIIKRCWKIKPGWPLTQIEKEKLNGGVQ
jgi:hypothetical protein